MVRKLTAADGPSVRAKAQTLAATMYPELIPDIEKMHFLLKEVLSSDRYYAYGIGPAEEPTAVLIARSQSNMWAMKKSATILLWYSDKPGQGVSLLRDFKRWVVAQKTIVLAGMTVDWAGHDGAEIIAEKVGFKQRGLGTYVFYPRGAKDGPVR